jgi:hypothetical protein
MRAYLSHPIRGKLGNKASDKVIQLNSIAAKSMAVKLRNKFNNLNIYVPAEHDEFIQIAWRKGYMSDTRILDVDCDIVSRCDLNLVYSPDGHISSGMATEINRAKEEGKPVVIFKKLTKSTIKLIQDTIKSLKENK